MGCEQADGIDVNAVIERVTNTMKKRMEQILKLNLYDINLIDAINTRVLPVAIYPMNVIRLSETRLKELENVIKREL